MSRGNEISENRYRVLNIREERVKQSRKKKEKKNMLQTYLKYKWDWVDRNPRTAAWLGWFKGLLTGFILYYFFIK
jgi:hypothetical protein